MMSIAFNFNKILFLSKKITVYPFGVTAVNFLSFPILWFLGI